MNLFDHIRDVPDFPKPGIVFKDISPLLASREATQEAIRAMAEPYRADPPEAILAVEARGFLFAVPMAQELGCGVVLVRKPGKLPAATTAVEYALEYGNDMLEMHADALTKGQKVLIVDDVLATGGTVAACADLARQAGAEVTAAAFLVELTFLNGRSKLGNLPVSAAITY
ncbi:adenine phosphoribosyltransferase [Alienimonas californiensis]|uniref:Adenine phosphoribosyltransferase n=1 Tax=Alienimonas californiensis TaxID=2527989 RepID=A0A517P928_9PLAN|nr:adenine phosphoribosyltransferase [Alienimonas californiensis]QDT15879.1 Adenine phosphoribosyltransferase [Alienimonas californiensis]